MQATHKGNIVKGHLHKQTDFMKRIALLLSLAVSGFTANAQLTLGSSPYTQNFDGIGSGLPTGWATYSGSTSTSLGAISAFSSAVAGPSMIPTDTTCINTVHSGGFKNYPSADVCSSADDWCATTPPTYSNRALGVRQVSPTNATHPNLDSGAAFVLQLANTLNDSAFSLSFNLQSLDSSSPRETTWQVDYSIGTPTNFIPVTTTTGTFKTGANTFANHACTANFGNALNNLNQPVYIRIVTLLYSAGSGNRASSAIDDYSLTWVPTSTAGIKNVSAQPATSLGVVGQATADNVTLAYYVENAGTYALSIYDLTGRVIHTETLNAQTGNQSISVNGLHLMPGMYIAKMNNSNSSATARIAVQ